MKVTSDKSWPDFIQDRYRWAEQSYASFLKKFDAQRLIQTTDNASGSVSVIVYGPSQVGKTSLILTLLGIRDACFNEVNTLLRGGQQLGTMSTARTYRYRMAKDDSWYFSHHDDGKTAFNDEQAVTIFAAFRQEVEDGSRVYDSVDVLMPRRFFDTERQNGTQLLIRDLPGTHSTNENERYYVNVLASRYLTSADVILLTGKVDGLSFLKPEALENNLLADWHWQRHRYKIVLTRAYSDGTLQRLIKTSEVNKAALQRFLLQQINTLELRLPESISELIYPVECGHTWLAINAGEDDYARRCQMIRSEVLTDLLASLKQAANPLARLRTGYALPKIIEQQMNMEQDLFDTELSYLQRQHSKLGLAVKKYIERIINNNRKTQRIYTALSGLEHAVEPDVAVLPHLDLAFAKKSGNPLNELKNCIYDSQRKLSDYWNKCLLDHQLPVENLPELINLDTERERLKKYWFDRYVFSKNLQQDLNKVNLASRQDANRLAAFISLRLRQKRKDEVSVLKQHVRRSVWKAARLKRILKHLCQKKGAVGERINRLQEDHRKAVNLYAQRHHESRNFLNVILAAKSQRAQEIENHVRDPAITASERLAWLLMYKVLNNDFAFVKSLKEENVHLEKL
ncbi:hypothetical protein [Leclercia sp. M50]|uniref:hypothetical protein n=1 Tax=Leclercia sp. M50 TaxID=3081258 RepID=UPI003019EB6F